MAVIPLKNWSVLFLGIDLSLLDRRGASPVQGHMDGTSRGDWESSSLSRTRKFVLGPLLYFNLFSLTPFPTVMLTGLGYGSPQCLAPGGICKWHCGWTDLNMSMFCICLGKAYSASPRYNSHCSRCRQADTAPRSFSLAHSSIVFSWFLINGFTIGLLGRAVCLQMAPVLVILFCCSSLTKVPMLC